MPARIPLAGLNVQRSFRSSASFLTWTNSGPAEWSTPFVTVASTLTFSGWRGPVRRARIPARRPRSRVGYRRDRGLEAQVMCDGMLVGYVPQIDGSEDFDESQIVDAIARTDYDQPIARQRTVAPPPAPPLPGKAASSAGSSTASATDDDRRQPGLT